MRPIRYILYVMAGLFGTAGCISTTSYPDDWSPLGTNAALQCPNLTGSYENYGLSAADSGHSYRPMLARVFFPQDGPGSTVLKAVSHMTVNDEGADGIVVKAWVGDELLAERRLTASQLPCIEGSRVLHETEFYGTGLYLIPLPIVTYSSIEHLISLAADGSLVMQNKDFGMGVALVIPVAGKGQGWYTFPRISPDTPGLHTDSSRPQGVRNGTAPAYSLLPPEDKTNSSIRHDVNTCLNMESWMGATPDPSELAMLGGRSTQAFVMQYCMDNCELQPQFREASWMRYVPATHTQRIEKMHWEPPSVADRYVICLLRKGYRWEDRGDIAVDHEFAIH